MKTGGFSINMWNETFGDIAKVEQSMRETIIMAIISVLFILGTPCQE